MQEALAKNGRVVHGFMLGVIEGVVPSSSALSLPAAPPTTTSIPLRMQHTRGAEYYVGGARADGPSRPKKESITAGVLNKACEYIFGW